MCQCSLPQKFKHLFPPTALFSFRENDDILHKCEEAGKLPFKWKLIMYYILTRVKNKILEKGPVVRGGGMRGLLMAESHTFHINVNVFH